MLLFDSIGPNAKMVRMFMAERGVRGVETRRIDLVGGENRREPYLSQNSLGQLPALRLDDGSVLTEIIAICEYLDEITDGPSLIGGTARERADTRMWARRIDLNILEPMANGFRYSEGLRLFTGRIRCIPQAADDLKAIARERLAWLDGMIAGRDFICGDQLTLADILLFPFLEFAATVKQALEPTNANLSAWYARMSARASARA